MNITSCPNCGDELVLEGEQTNAGAWHEPPEYDLYLMCPNCLWDNREPKEEKEIPY